MRTSAKDARERVLATARIEFAENGLAGARIDRISKDSATSKERLYAYFGSKQGLWVEAMTQEVVELDQITDVESLDGGAIVVRLFEAFISNPLRLKLFFWQLVEGAGPVDEHSRALQERKIQVVREAQNAGQIQSIVPADVVIRLLITTAANCAQEYLRSETDPGSLENFRAMAIRLGAATMSRP